jgi:hypothetical protein
MVACNISWIFLGRYSLGAFRELWVPQMIFFYFTRTISYFKNFRKQTCLSNRSVDFWSHFTGHLAPIDRLRGPFRNNLHTLSEYFSVLAAWTKGRQFIILFHSSAHFELTFVAQPSAPPPPSNAKWRGRVSYSPKILGRAISSLICIKN